MDSRVKPRWGDRPQAGVLTPANDRNATRTPTGWQNENGALSPHRGSFLRPLVTGVSLRSTPACDLNTPSGFIFQTVTSNNNGNGLCTSAQESAGVLGLQWPTAVALFLVLDDESGREGVCGGEREWLLQNLWTRAHFCTQNVEILWGNGNLWNNSATKTHNSIPL